MNRVLGRVRACIAEKLDLNQANDFIQNATEGSLYMVADAVHGRVELLLQTDDSGKISWSTFAERTLKLPVTEIEAEVQAMEKEQRRQ